MQLLVLLRRHLERPRRRHAHSSHLPGRQGRVADPDNVFYDKGGGLEPGMRLSGGALGKGLSENVREAYRWLVRRYADGAEIYVSASPGAPTPHARSPA